MYKIGGGDKKNSLERVDRLTRWHVPFSASLLFGFLVLEGGSEFRIKNLGNIAK